MIIKTLILYVHGEYPGSKIGLNYSEGEAHTIMVDTPPDEIRTRLLADCQTCEHGYGKSEMPFYCHHADVDVGTPEDFGCIKWQPAEVNGSL